MSLCSKPSINAALQQRQNCINRELCCTSCMSQLRTKFLLCLNSQLLFGQEHSRYSVSVWCLAADAAATHVTMPWQNHEEALTTVNATCSPEICVWTAEGPCRVFPGVAAWTNAEETPSEQQMLSAFRGQVQEMQHGQTITFHITEAQLVSCGNVPHRVHHQLMLSHARHEADVRLATVVHSAQRNENSLLNLRPAHPRELIRVPNAQKTPGLCLLHLYFCI
mmetsp:Transcript_46488/g.92344  ORF Transcript_46488/g.92344 Transcript_46488/m.92344 type:complete len:222 (-) Transcript_46488:511-1176(-)